MDFETVDVIEEVVQPTIAENVIDEGEQTQEEQTNIELQADPEPAQSQEENARFAENRRKQELNEAKKQLAFEKAEKQRVEMLLNDYGYKGSLQEIADQLEAERRQIEPTQVKQEREENDNQLHEIEKQHKAELSMLEDLHQIQRANPDIKSLDELGSEFFKIRFTRDGNGEFVYTAESAYNQFLEKTAKKPKPPSTGDINTTNAKEKDYFSPEDVDKMTQAEVEKNLDVIRKSQDKWR